MTKVDTKTHLYVRLKCPLCKWWTTKPESLGLHLVDKHPNDVIKGHAKIKKKVKPKKKE